MALLIKLTSLFALYDSHCTYVHCMYMLSRFCVPKNYRAAHNRQLLTRRPMFCVRPSACTWDCIEDLNPTRSHRPCRVQTNHNQQNCTKSKLKTKNTLAGLRPSWKLSSKQVVIANPYFGLFASHIVKGGMTRKPP